MPQKEITVDRPVTDVEYEQMLLIRHAIAQHRTEDGLERSAYLLMSRLKNQGPMTIAELRDAFRLDTSTVQRQTSAAMKAGLIVRIPDPDGGLAKRFTLSARGEELLETARVRYVSALERVMEAWTDDEVSLFAKLLRRFNLDIERYGSDRSTASMAWPRDRES